MLDKLKINNINIDDLDEEYWSNQPQVKLPNYSHYIIYPKQGLVWSKKTNKFIGVKNKKTGYWQCALTSDDGTIWRTTLCRVVWIAVNGDILNSYDVNHIDENKDNNVISNLNLMTRKENNNWGTHNERTAKAQSKQVGAFKDDVLVMTFPSTQEASRQGYNNGAVVSCCNGCFNRLGNNTYKGYQWRYI